MIPIPKLKRFRVVHDVVEKIYFDVDETVYIINESLNLSLDRLVKRREVYEVARELGCKVIASRIRIQKEELGTYIRIFQLNKISNYSISGSVAICQFENKLAKKFTDLLSNITNTSVYKEDDTGILAEAINKIKEELQNAITIRNSNEG